MLAPTLSILLAIAGSHRAQDPISKERWFVLDMDANPGGAPGRPGALFEIDPTEKTIEVVASSPLWKDPNDFLLLEDGSILVLDYRDEEAGALFRVSRDRREITRVRLPVGLEDPYGLRRREDGSFWIIDKNANPTDQDRPTGSVFRLSEDFRALGVVATGAPLVAPAALMFRPGQAPWLLDADALPELLNGVPTEGAIFELSDKVNKVIRPKGLVSPLDMLPFDAQHVLIVDVNANPRSPRPNTPVKPYWGALFKVNTKSGETTVVCRDDALRDPIRAVWNGDHLLVVDASADPLNLGPDPRGDGFGGNGRGAVFRVNPKTGECQVAFASPQFVNPIAIQVVRAQ